MNATAEEGRRKGEGKREGEGKGTWKGLKTMRGGYRAGTRDRKKGVLYC